MSNLHSFRLVTLEPTCGGGGGWLDLMSQQLFTNDYLCGQPLAPHHRHVVALNRDNISTKSLDKPPKRVRAKPIGNRLFGHRALALGVKLAFSHGQPQRRTRWFLPITVTYDEGPMIFFLRSRHTHLDLGYFGNRSNLFASPSRFGFRLHNSPTPLGPPCPCQSKNDVMCEPGEVFQSK